MSSILKPKQQQVWDDVLTNPQYNRICLYGSSRSGKTFLVADYAHERCVAYPGSFHLFVRSTLTALTTGVVSQTFPSLFRVYKNHPPYFINYTEAKNEYGVKLVTHKANPYNRFEYYNGSEIRFLGLDTVTTDSSALDKVLSQEYMTIIIEEGPEMDYEVVEMLLTRLAQKVPHYKTGNPGKPKMIVTLNPRLYEDWDYVLFHKHIHPIEHTPIKNPDRYAVVKFVLEDNEGNVAEDYEETLSDMSSSKRMRFQQGDHSDVYAGEIFKKLYWETMPPITEFDGMIIYTDPSYKSGPKNDFKASVLIGRRNGAFWLLNGFAMQTTTSQMILNVHNLYHWAVAQGWNRPVPIYFENAGMADDFIEAVHTHAVQHGWICPYQLDNRDKGEKYSRIESIMEPLNNNQKFMINVDLKQDRFGNLVTVQFLKFRRHLPATEHDDIPDACHGAVTLMNVPIMRPGQVVHVKKSYGNRG